MGIKFSIGIMPGKHVCQGLERCFVDFGISFDMGAQLFMTSSFGTEHNRAESPTQQLQTAICQSLLIVEVVPLSILQTHESPLLALATLLAPCIPNLLAHPAFKFGNWVSLPEQHSRSFPFRAASYYSWTDERLTIRSYIYVLTHYLGTKPLKAKPESMYRTYWPQSSFWTSQTDIGLKKNRETH